MPPLPITVAAVVGVVAFHQKGDTHWRMYSPRSLCTGVYQCIQYTQMLEVLTSTHVHQIFAEILCKKHRGQLSSEQIYPSILHQKRGENEPLFGLVYACVERSLNENRILLSVVIPRLNDLRSSLDLKLLHRSAEKYELFRSISQMCEWFSVRVSL